MKLRWVLLVCCLFQAACVSQSGNSWRGCAIKAFPIGDNWAQITWTTPQDADSVVEYGTTTSYGSKRSDANLYTGHRVTLFDLKPETKYHYRVLSKDAVGNTFVGPDRTFKTGPATVGCEVNVTGEPMGGGLGYSRIITPSQATTVVRNETEFLKALSSAKKGDIIYIDDKSVVDVSDQRSIMIPGGVTLASGRGRDGSVGGLIQYTKFETSINTPIFKTNGAGARITGLRFGGPSNALGRTIPMYHLLYVANYWTEIDNCEFWGWNYSAIETTANTQGLYVHHNYFHHNTRLGCGYAVNPSVGVALVEGNIFDFHRHSIASSGWAPSSYEARYNLVGEHSISHVFDMHGAVDSEVRTNVGIYRFDEAKGTLAKDTSTYGNNNPTLFGVNDASWVAGQLNTALQFDGARTYVDCGAGYKNNLSQKNFCIMGWIKPETVEGTQAIYSKATKSDGYALRLVGPALEATIFDASGAKRVQMAGNVAAGKWSHVGLSFDGATSRIYLNGKEAASFACDGVKQVTTSKLTIGRDSATATSFFKGAMDEIRIYRATMKPSDVERNYIGQGDIAGVEMRIHHNTSRVADQRSVVVRGKPAAGCWVNDNWFHHANDDENIRQLNAKGNMFIGANRYGPQTEKPAGSAPTLTWSGKENFLTAGVSPLKGTGSDVFRFEVKYTDPDGDAPAPGYPRLLLKRGGEVFLYLTPLTLMPLDNKGYKKGRTYFCELALPRGNDYSYSFEAEDVAGNKAAGAATRDFAGPVVSSGNAVPVLYPVMGHPNFVENWIYPSNGDMNTSFDIRITYLDTDNDEPQGGSPKVKITGSNGVEIPGSPFTMTAITKAQFANGRNYQLLTKLPVGEYQCQIVASDSQGASAVNVRTSKIVVLPAGAAAQRTALTPFD